MLLLPLLLLVVILPEVVTIRTVRVTLAAPSTGAGVLDKSMTQLLLRVWALLLSPALSLSWRLGMEPEALGRELFQALYFSDSGCFYIPSWFYIFPHSFQPSTNWCSVANLLPLSSLFGPLPTAPGLKTKAQAGWMICKFKAGTLTWVTIFLKSWSKGNFSDEEMTELQDPFESTSLDPLGLCRTMSSEFQLECEYSLWSGETLNEFLSLVENYCFLWSWSTPSLCLNCIHTALQSSLQLTLTSTQFPRLSPVSCTFICNRWCSCFVAASCFACMSLASLKT